MAFRQIATKISLIFLVSMILFSCTRINDSQLGLDFVSADGFQTRDTVLEVITETIDANDSLVIYPTDEVVLGKLTQDPLFGATNATLFLQLKPGFFPFYITGEKESIQVDSLVLILSYKGFYGDSTKPITLQVNQVDPSTPLSVTRYYASNYPEGYGLKIGPALANPYTVNFAKARDSVFNRFEKAANQIRIRLNDNLARTLIKTFDSTYAYKNDSLFRESFPGFAISTIAESNQNALIRLALLDSNTKLGLYYSTKITENTNRDTIATFFRFSYTNNAFANFITRNRTNSELAKHLNNTNDSLVYVQTSPGSTVKIKIPGLKSLSNRIIHRAELIAEQVPDDVQINAADTYMSAPKYLFLGVYDTATKKVRSVPNDYQGSSNFELLARFGGQRIYQNKNGYNSIATYNFNISRYVQGVISRTDTLFDFRLSAPVNEVFNYVPPYPYNKGGITDFITSSIANQPAIGRVRLGGGTHSKFRMRLHIYYTDL